MKRVLSTILLALLASNCLAQGKDKDKAEPKPAQSIAELQQQLVKILYDTHTPGASVAIVHHDSPEWVAGLGKADVSTGRATTPETLFRIGSTSKAFTALSVLLLVDQGKLSLDDPVHKLAPDVWFKNPWEATDPVRMVNVLEHTTGWDDMHLREYAKDAPPTMALRDALDYDHHSRISRWPPGTRMSYCNSGPPVAAYIVEKLTGQKFEDFVQQNLFNPIGMKTATYFPPPAGTVTTLYHDDGKTPFPYWNIIYRPAGSINASAQDMAAYVQFYLNRGKVNGVQVVPAADIDRMESPTSTWAAQQGLKAGYGLYNYWNVQNGFVYHGHNGGVEGGLTEMGYMADFGVGYSFSINTSSTDAFQRFSKAIRAYITLKLQKPALPPVASLPASSTDYAGWYEMDSPRVEMTHFLDQLLDISFVRFENGKLLLRRLGGWNETFLPVAGMQFRHVPEKESPDPVVTVELLTPNSEGRFIQVGGGTVTLKKIPAWFAILEILLTVYVVLSIIAIVIYAPFWILGGLSRKRRRPQERAMRLWPLIAVLSMATVVAIFIVCGDDIIPRLGNLTVWSAGIFSATIAIAVASVASALASWSASAGPVRKGVRRFSIIVTTALLVATVYLAYWGIIGLRTWG